MRKPLLMIWLVAVALSMAAQTAPVGSATNWQLDQGHTNPQFSVKHLGVSYVHGSFRKFSGTVHYDSGDLSKTIIEVTIDAASVDTGFDFRDKNLRSSYYLDVQRFPKIVFKSKKVEVAADGRLKVIGDLTVKAVTKEVALDVDPVSQPAKAPDGRIHIGTQATTSISRREFGVGNDDTVAVGEQVKITLDIDMVKP